MYTVCVPIVFNWISIKSTNCYVVSRPFDDKVLSLLFFFFFFVLYIQDLNSATDLKQIKESYFKI